MKIAGLRKEYSSKILEINKVDPDPIEQFKFWMEASIENGIKEPNAMHLSTVTPENRPSSRIVLLKGIDHGFVFFTNYESKKSRDLLSNPFASLTFFWPEMERQVRIEGSVEKVSQEESDEYFLSRPLESQIGAWASPQSEEIPDRDFLEKRKEAMESRFANEKLVRPSHWGGFRLLADKIEFWQGGPGRLHDRILYTVTPGKSWTIKRLAP
jgi:pyridoxamine 5'-phosphate oxidase